MAYGTALASFNVEEFGVERVARLTREEIAERVAELARITQLRRAADRAARADGPAAATASAIVLVLTDTPCHSGAESGRIAAS